MKLLKEDPGLQTYPLSVRNYSGAAEAGLAERSTTSPTFVQQTVAISLTIV